MGLEILYTIQSVANPVLDILFECITMLGEKVPLAGLFCLVYWCRDKRLGRALILSLGFATCFSVVTKALVRAPRPIGEPGIISRRVHTTGGGYSFPSGHTTSAASFFSMLAIRIRHRAVRFGCALIILLVAFSRLYLGVHYPADVLGGLAFGLLTALAVHWLLRKSWGPIVMIAAGLALCVGMLFSGQGDHLDAACLLFGVGAGLLFEMKWVRFSLPRDFTAGLVRLFLGLLLVGAFYLLPKLLLPDNLWLHAVRYMVLAFAATGGYPWLFVRLEAGRGKKSRKVNR